MQVGAVIKVEKGLYVKHICEVCGKVCAAFHKAGIGGYVSLCEHQQGRLKFIGKTKDKTTKPNWSKWHRLPRPKIYRWIRWCTDDDQEGIQYRRRKPPKNQIAEEKP